MVFRLSQPEFGPQMSSKMRTTRDFFDRSEWQAVMPAMDVTEYEEAFEFVAELPGVKKEDIRVVVENGVLRMTAERKRGELPERTKIVLQETSHNPFRRTFRLPKAVEETAISAELKDGVLRVRVPKAETARSREISIR